MSLAEKFFNMIENDIPDVMVPNEILNNSFKLSKILKSIFIVLEKAHNSPYNIQKEFVYNFVEKDINDIPSEHHHFIHKFNVFFINQTIGTF